MARSGPLACGVALLGLSVLAGLAHGNAAPSQPPSDYPYQAVPFTAVRLSNRFWLPRIESNRTATIPLAFRKCEETGRVENFKIAAGLMHGLQRGTAPFDDSDVYKVIEGASYTLSVKKDPQLEAYLDQLIGWIAAAQEKDGYLYTARTNHAPYLKAWAGDERWSREAGSHELYNLGHLYEAAVAHYQATGKRTLLDVAIKSADLVDHDFGPGKVLSPPGHQVIEMGLAKLYRVTGEVRYLRLAKFFLDTRGKPGHPGFGNPYNQDHKPVLEQDEAVGHAVRATYMYSGMADVAALTGDRAYADADRRLWENVVTKKLYVTGGVGARGDGERFGADYELPNLTAYSETCASVANVLWNQRLFQLDGDAKYVDVLERTLYNALLAGVSLDGKSFFYPNPLASYGQYARSPWFGCACCPSNVARFMASVPGYVYARRGRDLYVNLYAGGAADVDLDGTAVNVTQKTNYPWDGAVKITVAPQAPATFAVDVRIPGWAVGRPVPGDLYRFQDGESEPPTLKVNGSAVEVKPVRGYVRIEREWKAGDVVDLNLPMPVRRVVANDKVERDAGRVALQRGPVVFCAESADQPDRHVNDLVVPDGAPLSAEFRPDLLGGVEVVTGKVQEVVRGAGGRPEAGGGGRAFMAVPYYAWAHRGQGEMAVWLPRELSAAQPAPSPTIAAGSKATASANGELVAALADQMTPEVSSDKSLPFFHWWPQKGSVQWVRYDFARRTTVASCEVFWMVDIPSGECDLPASWRLLYHDAGQWRPVPNPDRYGVEKDRFNRVRFDPVEADGLRLEVQLKPTLSAGIHEWKVDGPENPTLIHDAPK